VILNYLLKLPVILALLLALLTTYRLCRFAVEDGPFGIFVRFRTFLGQRASVRKEYGLTWTLAELAACPYCLGLYVAPLAFLLVIFPSLVGNVVLFVLGLAGALALLLDITKVSLP
jgi:hypothetical protein